MSITHETFEVLWSAVYHVIRSKIAVEQEFEEFDSVCSKNYARTRQNNIPHEVLK